MSYSKYHYLEEAINKISDKLNIQKDYIECLSLCYLSILYTRYNRNYRNDEFNYNLRDALRDLKDAQFGKDKHYVDDEVYNYILGMLTCYIKKEGKDGWEDLSDDDIPPFSQFINDKVCEEAISYFNEFDQQLTVKRDTPLYKTPDYLCKVANQILEINENDNVADFCCGIGNFLKTVSENSPFSSLVGFEIGEESYVAMMIRDMEIMINDRIKDYYIENVDVIGGITDESGDKATFSKIFCDMPIFEKIPIDEDIQKIIDEGNINLSRKENGFVISEKVFIQSILSSLEENGKACVLMLTSFIINDMYTQFMKDLADKGLIECVIQFNNRLFYPGTHMAYSLIILSHNKKNTKAIKMVNASSFFSSNRLQSYLSDDNINDIVKIYKDDKESEGCSKYVSSEDFIKFEDGTYNLLPYAYTVKKEEKKEDIQYVPLTDICDIKRGYTAKFDDLIKNDEENKLIKDDKYYKYLTPSSLIDFSIVEEYSYFVKDNKASSSLLKENQLVLSTIKTKPLKIGYTNDIKDVTDKEVVASTNMYIISVKEECDFNPVFIKAFLEKITTYNFVDAINPGLKIYVKSLEQIKIPCLTRKEQDKIAKSYLEERQKILNLRKELNDALTSFDDLRENI